MPTPRRGRLLIIDDDPLMGTALRRTLGSENDVTLTESAKEALALITNGAQYDVLLCDLTMPGMSGMVFHAKLLALTAEQAARIVFITGGLFTPDARDFLAQVPNPCIQKPFDVRELRLLVRERVAGIAA